MPGEGFVILLSAIYFPSFCFFPTQESTLKNGNSNLLKSNGMLVQGKGQVPNEWSLACCSNLCGSAVNGFGLEVLKVSRLSCSRRRPSKRELGDQG